MGLFNSGGQELELKEDSLHPPTHPFPLPSVSNIRYLKFWVLPESILDLVSDVGLPMVASFRYITL